MTKNTVDTSGVFGHGIYSLQMHVTYPEGEGKQRGGIAVMDRNQVYMTPFVVNKGGEDEARTVATAMADALRQLPGRPVVYSVSGNAAETRALGPRLSGALSGLDRSLREVRTPLRGVRALSRHVASAENNWNDAGSALHLYLCALGEGETCDTAVLAVGPRRVTYAHQRRRFFDPTAAVFEALHDTIRPLAEFARVPVWTPNPALKDALNKKKSMQLSQEAVTTLGALRELRARKEIELRYQEGSSLYAQLCMAYLGSEVMRGATGSAEF